MMYRKSNNLGYGLLETIVVILLSAYLMQAVLGFFCKVYMDVERFQEKMMYDTEARIVSQFISDEIRTTEQVEIMVKTSQGDKLIMPGMVLESSGLRGYLKEIRVYSTNGIQGVIKLKTNRNEEKGKYSLVYVADDSVTQNLICDVVEEINVSCDSHADYIKFECKIGRQKEGTIKSQIDFTQCLIYKEGMKHI